MAGGGDVAAVSYAATRRKALTGQSGWVRTTSTYGEVICLIRPLVQAGLVHNRRVFATAVFASLGGL